METSEVTKTYIPRAIDRFNPDQGTTLMGVWLFNNIQETNLLAPDYEPAPGPALQLCLCDSCWVQCPRGLPDLVRAFKSAVLCAAQSARRLGVDQDTPPSHWCIVADVYGVISHIVHHYGVMREIGFLGRSTVRCKANR